METQKEMVMLLLQFLDEEKYTESLHKLEQESGFFFDLNYFEEKVLLGEWDEVEKYLCGFTKADDNDDSLKTFLEIKKQKYLEALDRHDNAKAVEILQKELKVFQTSNIKLYEELTHLLCLDNFRENQQLSYYVDTQSARGQLIRVLRKLIERNPLFREKLDLPAFDASRLKTLINQSLNLQCENPNLYSSDPIGGAAVSQFPMQPSQVPLLKHHGQSSNSQRADHEQPTKRLRSEPIAAESNPVEPVEFIDPALYPQLTIPDRKVARLLYTNSGLCILALETIGVVRQWMSCNEENPTGKASASLPPDQWQANNSLLMVNDVLHEVTFPCIALSKDDARLVSSSGGNVSLFNIENFKLMTTYGGKVSLFNMENCKLMGTSLPPPPASTFLAFHPQDNNIIAIGMEDATILIYNVKLDEVKATLKGHKKHITGLAFSVALNILVSASVDAQLFFWSTKSWKMKNSLDILQPGEKSPTGDTGVQFHNDEVHLLVSLEPQIEIYDCSKMKWVQEWVPVKSPGLSILCATYSCNCQSVYVLLKNGCIGILDAENLKTRCVSAASEYLAQSTSNSSPVMPLVIAANPKNPHEIAVGLSDGNIEVIDWECYLEDIEFRAVDST